MTITDIYANALHSCGYYTVCSITDMEDVRTLFPEGKADDMNWCFLSTDGVHGSNSSLDTEIEDFYAPHGFEQGFSEDEPYEGMRITVLIVMPRIVRTYYGTINITMDDIPFLRGLVTSTIRAVEDSQYGNVNIKDDD